MKFTIFCDASFGLYGAAGYGSWMVRSDWHKGVLHSGQFRQPMPSSFAAELAAIAKVWGHAQHQGWLTDVDFMQIQSDCVPALSRVRYLLGASNSVAPSYSTVVHPSRPKKDKPVDPVVQQICDVLVKLHALNPCKLDVRHVKGHTKGGTGRQWVNNECDRLAKQHRLNMEKELRP